jgi:phosphoglycolate phosphatase
LAEITETQRFVRPRAVLFDWDNTLVENWRTIQAALNAALTDAGLAEMDMEQVMFQGRHSAQDIFPKLFGDGWHHARTIFYEHFAQNHLDGLSIMPGAQDLLDALRGRDVMLGVVSNKKGDLLRREIDFLGWSGRFSRVVGAQDAAADKPDPAPVYLALKDSGIAPSSDVWLVGDTDIDMRTAVAAGCYPVLVGPGPADASLLKGAEPALRCHNCGDLAGFVSRNWDTISL